MRRKALLVSALLLAGGTVWGQQYLITSVAGGGLPDTPAAVASTVIEVDQLAANANNLYFAGMNCVWKVDGAGVLTRVAGGSRHAGYSGDGGVATSARLNTPAAMAVDGAGNVYIADQGNNVVRKVAAATGIITTVAGNGTAGYTGDGGAATAAELNQPSGVAADGAGNLYILDETDSVVRKVAAGTGVITTAAGTGVRGYTGDGGAATAAELNGPEGMALNATGDLYIADTGNGRVRKVAAATGILTTVAGGGSQGPLGGVAATSFHLPPPIGVWADGRGNFYINAGTIYKVGSDGIITVVPVVPAGEPTAVPFAVDTDGNFYYAMGNVVIYKVAAVTGAQSIVAGGVLDSDSGEGGPGASAELNYPSGLAVDGAGNLYIADLSRVRKLNAATGIITTVAGNGVFNYLGNEGDGGPATSLAISANAIAVDGSGNLYIGGDFWVRKVAAATGTISTIAGNGNAGVSGDGGPATAAAVDQVMGMVLDGAGNLYIADGPVRKIDAASGIITTVTVGVDAYELAIDSSGYLYLADYAASDEIIKAPPYPGPKVTVAGGGTAFPGDGGPATSAQVVNPTSVAVDGAGNVYFGGVDRIVRRVAAGTGILKTIGGIPETPYNADAPGTGDGGPATSAVLGDIDSLAVDGAGNVYVSEGERVRALVPVGSALLSVTSAHAENFTQGQTGAVYTVTVTNATATGPTNGAVTVTEVPGVGLTVSSMTGSGWSCGGGICSRSDVLAAGASYPAITVTVNVAADAPVQTANRVAVTGGGSPATGATDLTTVGGLPAAPVLVAPVNGASGVFSVPTLTWSVASRAISYDVYLGVTNPPPLVTNTMALSYTAGQLNTGTTYYWQVVARNDVGQAGSETRSFTTGAQTTGLRFVPVTPCRVADTRLAAGQFGGPSIMDGTVRTFAIPQSGCGIPATAQAYSLNVTAVPLGPLQYVTLWPDGQSRPLVSTLNSMDGNVVANAAIVPAGAGGAIDVFASGSTDVVLDINGYFDVPEETQSYWFYATTPCRVADTRETQEMAGGESRAFPVGAGNCPLPPEIGNCGIPVAVRACGLPIAPSYAMNVTVVPSGHLGFLTAWAGGPARPFVSTLNSWTGDVVANAAIVPAASDGSISIYVTNPTQVVLDVNGYFAGQLNTATPLSFYPVPPCRVADTRNADGPFGGPVVGGRETRTFQIPASNCYVPPTAAAYSLNVTAVPDGYLGYLSVWPAGSAQPNVSTLNSWDGTVVANAAIVPAGTNGAIDVYVTNPTHVILDINGYFAP